MNPPSGLHPDAACQSVSIALPWELGAAHLPRQQRVCLPAQLVCVVPGAPPLQRRCVPIVLVVAAPHRTAAVRRNPEHIACVAQHGGGGNEGQRTEVLAFKGLSSQIHCHSPPRIPQQVLWVPKLPRTCDPDVGQTSSNW